MSRTHVFAAVLAGALSLAAAPGARAQSFGQSVTTGGVTINVLPFPSVPVFTRPAAHTGHETQNATGQKGSTNPMSGPFVSLSQNASATYVFAHPSASVAFIWGSPDNGNVATFYDVNGSVIGQVTGATLFDTNLGNGGYFEFILPAPVASIVFATDAGCCFEFTHLIQY